MKATPNGTPRRSLPEKVAGSVRAAIFAGRYQPGDPLTELGLSAEHGVSQAAVREALSTLAHEGLVRRIPNKGTLVNTLSEREAAERTRLRTLLETVAAADAAPVIAPAALRELDRRVAEIEKAVRAHDYSRAAVADIELHRCIWKAAGDGTLYRVLDQITGPLFAFVSMRRSWRRADWGEGVVEDHRRLAQALRSRDPQEAAAVMRRHFENSDARSMYAQTRSLDDHLPRTRAVTKPRRKTG